MDINFGKIANALKSVAKNHIVAVAEDIYDEALDMYQSVFNHDANQIVAHRNIIPRYKVIQSVDHGTVQYDSNIILCTKGVYNDLEEKQEDVLYLITDGTEVYEMYLGTIYVDLRTNTITGITNRLEQVEDFINTFDASFEAEIEGLSSRIEIVEIATTETLPEVIANTKEELEGKIDQNWEILSAECESNSDMLESLGDMVNDLIENDTASFIGIFSTPEELEDMASESGVRTGWGYVGTDTTRLAIYQYSNGSAHMLYRNPNNPAADENYYDITSFNDLKRLVDRVLGQVVIMSESEYEACVKEGNKIYYVYEDED